MALDPRLMSKSQVQDAHVDVGLRQYMLGVYNHMTIGLAITGLVALGASFAAIQGGQLTGFGYAIYMSPLKWVIMLAPIGMVFFFAAKLHSMASSTAQVVFWIYAALMGLSLSSIFLVYTGESITRVFFIAAGMFAGTSLYGYTTKKRSHWDGVIFIYGADRYFDSFSREYFPRVFCYAVCDFGYWGSRFRWLDGL